MKKTASKNENETGKFKLPRTIEVALGQGYGLDGAHSSFSRGERRERGVALFVKEADDKNLYFEAPYTATRSYGRPRKFQVLNSAA